MLTFQILDDGDVLIFTLGDEPVTIGSDPACELRLAAPGVAPRHARVEPFVRQGQAGYKLTDLGGKGGTRVNGEAVAQVALAVGDRIEIGAATLVLGRKVLRRATPADVLADAVTAPRPRARATPPPRRGRFGLIAGGLALLALAGWLFLGEGSSPRSLRSVVESIERGDLDRAQRTVDGLRAWAGADAARVALLEGHAREVARARECIARLEREVRDHAGERTEGEQIQELKERAKAGDLAERVAARSVLSRLTDLRLAAAAALRPPPADAVPVPSKPTPDTAPPAAVAKEPSSPPPAAASALERAQALLAKDDLRGAARALAEAGVEPRAAAMRAAVEARAEALAGEWSAAAEELVALGFGGDAAAMLRQRAGELPEAQAQRLLARSGELAAARGPEPAAAPAASPGPDPLGGLLRALEAAEGTLAAGRFAQARDEFQAVAERVAGRDARFAAELRARAEDCALLGALHEAVAASLRLGAKPELPLADGARVRLLECTETGLRVTGEQGEQVLAWGELPAGAVDALLRGTELPAEAWLGAAVLALGAGDEAAVQARLVAAVRRDAAVKQRGDALLARARGEAVPSGGYRLEGGTMVAAGPSAAVARELESRLESALRQRGTKAREAALADVLARGPEHLDTVVGVLRRVQQKVVGRLHTSPMRKGWEKVAAARDRLDAARAHALELIFDEQRYFYPYKPPAVSSEKAREYAEVQREVDARVAAVREAWNADVRVPVPAAIAAEVERLDWLSGVLAGFGEPSEAATARVRWAQSLPAEPVLTVQNFCRDPEELGRWRLARRIQALNEKRGASLSAAEREQLAVTNAYRVMMGRRPLVVDQRILAAARGHCEEMEKLGYFGHFSPVAKHRSPYDRMRLCGYAHGSSENIATNGSAAGAHDAWLHSSGHHRNILGPHHTEFACGQRGHLWTQNFGAGRDFERELPD